METITFTGTALAQSAGRLLDSMRRGRELGLMMMKGRRMCLKWRGRGAKEERTR